MWVRSVNTAAVAQTAPAIGVIAVGNPTGSIGVGVIVTTNGPAFTKMTGAVTVGQAAQTSTTAGYAQSAASVGAYKDAGLITTGVSTTCTAATNCQYSSLVSVKAH